MKDDMLDAFKHMARFWTREADLAAGVLPTQRVARTGQGKSTVGSDFLEMAGFGFLAHKRLLQEIFIFDDVVKEHGDERIAMHRALKSTKSQHLRRWQKASYKEQDDFIARVRRQGVKPYPNLEHMRDLHAAFAAELVFAELKD
jgi:hypothetical protein